MRIVKKFLVVACDIGVLYFGLFFSAALAGTIAGVAATWFDSRWNNAAAPVVLFGFLTGLVLTGLGFAAMRRKTRRWEIEWDAAAWVLSRAERRLHPARARCKRIARRILVWAPSAIAAGVLFFLPVATHVVHPGSRYLRHYRVPIPWNVTVFSSASPRFGCGWIVALASSSGKGRYGVTPFWIWKSEQLSSEMLFEARRPEADAFEFNGKRAVPRRRRAAQESQREFQLGGVGFTCRQSVNQDHYGAWIGGSGGEPLWWNVECVTPVGVRERNLHAWFVGREEDVPVFYKIIEGVVGD